MTMAFGKFVEQGTFIENIVSRKKQIIPLLINAINALK